MREVTVHAGELDRDRTIVSFQYPDGAGQLLALRDAAGEEYPVQVDESGTATFILPALEARTEARFTLVPGAERPQVALAEHIDGVVRFSIAGRAVVDFQLGSRAPAGVDQVYERGGYLHPLRTPTGNVVTDDYPEDHRHHHGIWTAWTRTTFDGNEVDFWNVQSGQGRVDLSQVQRTWRGPVHAGLEASLDHVSLVNDPTIALEEHWRVRVYNAYGAGAAYFVVDLESHQKTATASPLELQEYIYGGVALRGHTALTNVANAIVLTSEHHDRSSGDGQPGRWCYLGGNVDGRTAGYAALGHPDNFRAPQKLRIHPTDPYVAFSPIRDGAFTIHPNTPYRTRFRFVSTDGPPDAALFDRLWNDYATPPRVTVGPR